MHPYLTAVHRACCAVVHIITARPTYSSIIAAAAKQTPFAFFLNPNQTRPLSAGTLFIVHSRCHYSHWLSHSTSLQFYSHSRPPCTEFQKPQAHLRSLVARGH
jgi:hypothetical protein